MDKKGIPGTGTKLETSAEKLPDNKTGIVEKLLPKKKTALELAAAELIRVLGYKEEQILKQNKYKFSDESGDVAVLSVTADGRKFVYGAEPEEVPFAEAITVASEKKRRDEEKKRREARKPKKRLTGRVLKRE
jgi:hypothetical protein